MGKGKLFVLSAPSGAGKSTLIEKIRPLFPDMAYSISCTTRLPRNREIHGVHYYFVSKDRFLEMIDQDKFLEWKEVHGNMYGTPVDPVMETIESGRRMILDIDVQGAAEVFDRFPEATGVFISAPDDSTLEQRLRARGTDSEESIRTRLSNARRETELAGMFHYKVVNDDLEQAAAALASIIADKSKECCAGKNRGS